MGVHGSRALKAVWGAPQFSPISLPTYLPLSLYLSTSLSLSLSYIPLPFRLPASTHTHTSLRSASMQNQGRELLPATTRRWETRTRYSPTAWFVAIFLYIQTRFMHVYYLVYLVRPLPFLHPLCRSPPKHMMRCILYTIHINPIPCTRCHDSTLHYTTLHYNITINISINISINNNNKQHHVMCHIMPCYVMSCHIMS